MNNSSSFNNTNGTIPEKVNCELFGLMGYLVQFSLALLCFMVLLGIIFLLSEKVLRNAKETLESMVFSQ
jgi:flagellar biosynthesis/type III secretory pathway M-ring protein FliF/YscJ